MSALLYLLRTVALLVHATAVVALDGVLGVDGVTVSFTGPIRLPNLGSRGSECGFSWGTMLYKLYMDPGNFVLWFPKGIRRGRRGYPFWPLAPSTIMQSPVPDDDIVLLYHCR